ncbi:MAG: hypothetical protein ABI640_13020 [Gammaproteobacteria bacterium]
MTGTAECPVQAASAGAHGSSNGPGLLETEQPLSLPDAVAQLARAIDGQNQLLGQIVAQNADLISMLANADDEDEPLRDLSGRLL